MTNYSDDPCMMRVDFFKSSGKWYTTEAVKWTAPWECNRVLIHDGFKKSLRDHFKENPDRLTDMDAICLEPYHEYSHPICIRNGGWKK